MTYPLAFRFLTVLCSACAVAFAPALLAQEQIEAEADASAMDEIVVEGERIIDLGSPGGLAREVARRPKSTEPMPRLNDPLCLQLAIDDETRGLEVGRRIIANARAADIAIAPRGCRPNALVLIADDMRTKIDEFRNSGRRFFGSLKRHQIDRALRVRDPVYVFHDIFFKSNKRGGVDRTTRKNLVATAVMIESRVSTGFSVEQIADYATLRLLAPSRELSELEGGGSDTLLTMFVTPDSAPPEMSRSDRAYLTLLYRLPGSASAVQILLEMERMMNESEAAPVGQ